MITILLNRSFHSDERVCNEKGETEACFFLFGLFIMNRVVSQSLPCINNAHMHMQTHAQAQGINLRACALILVEADTYSVFQHHNV